MSSRMPFPTGRKSLCFRGWGRGQRSVGSSARGPWPAAPAQACPRSPYLWGSVYADGVHVVALGADGWALAHHGEQLSLVHQGLLEFLLRAGAQELLAEGDVQEHGGERAPHLRGSLGAFLGVGDRSHTRGSWRVEEPAPCPCHH